MSPRFSKSARLSRSAEFRTVRNRGNSHFGRFLIVNVLLNAEEADAEDPPVTSAPAAQPSRIGIVTSRRVGNAVVRNLTRRRLREIVRADLAMLPRGLWLVLVARTPAAAATFQELQAEWRRLGGRAKLLAR